MPVWAWAAVAAYFFGFLSEGALALCGLCGVFSIRRSTSSSRF